MGIPKNFIHLFHWIPPKICTSLVARVKKTWGWWGFPIVLFLVQKYRNSQFDFQQVLKNYRLSRIDENDIICTKVGTKSHFATAEWKDLKKQTNKKTKTKTKQKTKTKTNKQTKNQESQGDSDWIAHIFTIKCIYGWQVAEEVC